MIELRALADRVHANLRAFYDALILPVRATGKSAADVFDERGRVQWNENESGEAKEKEDGEGDGDGRGQMLQQNSERAVPAHMYVVSPFGCPVGSVSAISV